jgi:hypothetical protein
MTHITTELLSDKNLSLWIVSIAILAFAAGYGLGTARYSGMGQAINSAGPAHFSDLAMGKYGHLSRSP